MQQFKTFKMIPTGQKVIINCGSVRYIVPSGEHVRLFFDADQTLLLDMDMATAETIFGTFAGN